MRSNCANKHLQPERNSPQSIGYIAVIYLSIVLHLLKQARAISSTEHVKIWKLCMGCEQYAAKYASTLVCRNCLCTNTIAMCLAESPAAHEVKSVRPSLAWLLILKSFANLRSLSMHFMIAVLTGRMACCITGEESRLQVKRVVTP